MCIAAAIGGAALVGGIVQGVGAKHAADVQARSARQAADTQAQAAKSAISQQQAALGPAITQEQAAATQSIAGQQAALQQVQGTMSPYTQAGSQAQNALSRFYGLPGTPGGSNFGTGGTPDYNKILSNLPGYQFQLQQGDLAAQRQMNASGMFQSGAAPKELSIFNQGLAQNYAGQYASGLSGIAGQGANAAGLVSQAQLGTAGDISNIRLGSAGAIGNWRLGTASQIGNYQMGAANNIGSAQIYAGNAQAQGQAGLYNAIGSGLSGAAGAYGMYNGYHPQGQSSYSNPAAGQIVGQQGGLSTLGSGYIMNTPGYPY